MPGADYMRRLQADAAARRVVTPPVPLDESSSEEVVDYNYIVREKPDIDVVREYFKHAVAEIDEDD